MPDGERHRGVYPSDRAVGKEEFKAVREESSHKMLVKG
jgi:hypothetical protein